METIALTIKIKENQLVTDRCYIGVEAEGPFRRKKKLLFVPGIVSVADFYKAWDQVKHEVDGIYYGAGTHRALDADTMRAIRTTPCEVKMVEFYGYHDGGLYVFDFKSEKLYKKVETKLFTIWVEQPQCYFTWLSDSLFETDKIVEFEKE